MDFLHPTFIPALYLKIIGNKKNYVCHSQVIDGNITFLHDSTHALRGKTVVLPYLNTPS